ncbi:MAG: F-type H+-transporting ATPase subunit delta [Chloroflexota bacterium]|nr:F-type H+-transporting ATPase subunit delta [Chloroflexota bacterium]
MSAPDAGGAAGRYAHAAFEVASAKHQLPGWRTDLSEIERIFSDPDVSLAFANPRLDDRKRIGLALALLPQGFDRDRSNFVKLLVMGRRTDLAGAIRDEFEALLAEAEGRTELRLTLAEDLPAEGRRRLSDLLSKKLGREVTVEFDVDPSLIGGGRCRR